MPLFTRVDWQVTSEEDFIFQSNEHYRERYGGDLNNDQIEWLQIIYQEYADDNGEVDFTHNKDNEPWYYYMSEVLGLDDDTIDRYSED